MQNRGSGEPVKPFPSKGAFWLQLEGIHCMLRASLVAQMVKNTPATQETPVWGFNPCIREIPWRREPTPIFLPREFHGQRSLAGCSPWGYEVSDMTEWRSGDCVISSVLSCYSKNLKRWTSVTAQFQLSFIWQAKENTSLRCDGRLTQKKRVAQFWLLFLKVFFLSQACPM